MYAVKKATSDGICHGCLCRDRRLSPLTNHELYIALLDSKRPSKEYSNVQLCWECTALLRSAAALRSKLQLAQHLLSLARQRQVAVNLSTLHCHHKQDYDCTIEESTESKPDLFVFIDNTENIDIKEEFCDDQFENDHFGDNECKDVEIKVKKHQKKKHSKEKRKVEKTEIPFDFNELELYFTECCLSEKEVEESFARDRDDGDAVSRPFKCSICGFRFAKRQDFSAHKKDYHKKQITKCPICGSQHSSRADLQLHWRRSHPVHRCRRCTRVLECEGDRMRHLYLHKFRYKCLKCGIEFDNMRSFRHHDKKLHSFYVCDYCNRSTALKKSLEKHIKRAHLPAVCGACTRRFPSGARLARHARAAHAPDSGAYCVECDRSFVTRAQYSRHLSQSVRHRPKKKVSVPCPECGKVFSRKAYMTNHVRLFHSNDSKHHCNICDKSYVTAFALRSHCKYVHEKIPMPKNKICGVCGRGFATNRVLDNHMRTHTGERPFACMHCTAAFAQRVALRAHLAAIHKDKSATDRTLNSDGRGVIS